MESRVSDLQMSYSDLTRMRGYHKSDLINDRQSDAIPDSKVHGANMGPTWGRQNTGGPRVGPMNLAIWDDAQKSQIPVSFLQMAVDDQQKEHPVPIMTNSQRISMTSSRRWVLLGLSNGESGSSVACLSYPVLSASTSLCLGRPTQAGSVSPARTPRWQTGPWRQVTSITERHCTYRTTLTSSHPVLTIVRESTTLSWRQ